MPKQAELWMPLETRRDLDVERLDAWSENIVAPIDVGRLDARPEDSLPPLDDDRPDVLGAC